MFSIIIAINNTPGDNRYDLLNITLAQYYRLHPNLYERFPGLELILVTMTGGSTQFRVDKIVKSDYTDSFNPAKAYNLGVEAASNENIILTCPEVFPITPVLDQFATEIGNHVIAQVFEDGDPLVNSTFRSEFPGLYFLGLLNKKDIVAINGWDEDFMQGYGWEDTDFGERFKRAGFTYKIRDDIQAIHMKHPRLEKNWEKFQRNRALHEKNNAEGIIRPKNGLLKL